MKDQGVNRMLKQFGGNLRAWRLGARLKQKVIADELGVSTAIVSEWEHGQRYPCVENLVYLARLSGRALCQLLCAHQDCRARNTASGSCPLCQ